MMNRVEAGEIVTLDPGASREITDWVSWPPFPSGTYDLRLTYRNDPELLGRSGDASDAVKQLIAGSSACEVTTDTIRATLP